MRDYLPIIIIGAIALTVFILLWRKGAFLRISDYFRQTQEELRKCTWPTWEELMGSTVVVIVSVAFLGGFTVAIDFLVANLIRLIV
jgi:preprotein translocase subunit SecE